MSTIIAQVFGNRIVVGADTLADLRCVDGRREAHVAKLVPIPHFPAVIAARGEVRQTGVFAGAALMSENFDTFLEHLQTVADHMPQILPKEAADFAMEMVLAGWSSRRQRLVGVLAVRPEGGGQLDLSEIHADAYAPPPFADGREVQTPHCNEDRVAIARLQAERIRGESEGVAGGDLTVATVTRDGVNVEIVRGFA